MHTYKELASDFACSQRTVKRAVKRLGLKPRMFGPRAEFTTQQKQRIANARQEWLLRSFGFKKAGAR